MVKTHDLSLGRFRSDLKTIGKGFTSDKEAVVARCVERIGKSFKKILPVVMDRGCFPMHQALRTDNLTSKNITHALMTETDPEDRKFSGEGPDYLVTDTGFLGSAGPRRNADPLRVHFLNFPNTDLIISLHQGIRSEFPEILDEIVGEGIVVIDDQDHDRKGAGDVAAASSMARTTPMALFTVSSNSASGLESATMPAPA